MTIKKRLNEESLYKQKFLLKPFLSENYRENRLNQAKVNKNIDQSIMVFTDKTTFLQFSKLKKV